MSHSQRLTAAHRQQTQSLLFELYDLRHSASAQFSHLAAGAARLVGCTSGLVAEMADWGPRRPYIVRRMEIAGPEVDRLARAVSQIWSHAGQDGDPSFTEGSRLPGELVVTARHRFAPAALIKAKYPVFQQVCHELHYRDHGLAWFRIGRGKRDAIGLAVHRWESKASRLNTRQLNVLGHLIRQLQWLHRSGRFEPVMPGLAELTPRLRQILRALLAGHPPKQIAEELDLSVHTVRDHIQRLYDHFNVRGREALAAKFVRFE